MRGSSSTWYAIRARVRISRSSAARFVASEDAKQLLRGIDDRVRILRLEPVARVNAAPRDGDGAHPCPLRCAHVERRVPDVRTVRRVRPQPSRAEKERLRIRLVPLRLVPADDRVEEVCQWNLREGEI